MRFQFDRSSAAGPGLFDDRRCSARSLDGGGGMIRWLYDHVFRGIGYLLLVGIITILILAIRFQR